MPELQELINQYQNIQKKLRALDFINYIVSWDSETEAPIGCFDLRAKQIGVISEMSYDILMNEQTKQIVNALYNQRDRLTSVMNKEITNLYKNIKKKELIPATELINYEMLLSKTPAIWAEAKQENNFELFRPYLEEIVSFNRKYTKYLETETLKGYDVLLDEYEEGSSTSFYDKFFSLLKQEIVPLVKKITSMKLSRNESFLKHKYNVNLQKKFCNYLMQEMKFNFFNGFMKESEHPFTSGFGTTDVRITNHYYENAPTSSIFSTIHETGHALYEMQCDEELDDTLVGGGTSMAVHESQSRFYENIIGRNYAFWKKHYPKLQSTFKKQLKDTTLDDFYLYINKVENSLIRTEADELTYSIHIMIRYELEKGLIDGSIEVKDLPTKWNQMYKEYLGIDVPSDTQGVLQDIHWAGGSIGYFPTYALGSAYAAQFYNAMQKDLNIEQILENEDLTKINEWLKEKVHRFGQTKTPKEILLFATNEEFNPVYYVDYLKNKYKKIYNI